MTSDRVPPHDLVVFKVLSSPLEAELVANLLRAADIPVYVEGSLLADEFAVSQRLLGLGSVRLQVPRDSVPEAEAVLAEAREASAFVDAEAEATVTETSPAIPAAPRTRARSTWVLPMLRAIAAVVFLVKWLDAETALRVALQSGTTYVDTDADTATSLTCRWRDSGELACRYTDIDANGVAEVIEAIEERDKDGKLIRAWSWQDGRGFAANR